MRKQTMITTPLDVRLTAVRTSAEYDSLISDLDTALNAAVARKADLEEAEDRAIFGDGDLATVRAEMSQCDDKIATLQKTIDGAISRRAKAAQDEAARDIETLGRDAKAKAAELSKHWRRVYEHIEAIRAELFACDALKRSLIATDGEFERAKRPDLKVNLMSVRREAMAGPRAAIPDRLSRPAVQADKLLLSFLSLGGPLETRAGVGAPVAGVSSNSDFHHPAERGA